MSAASTLTLQGSLFGAGEPALDHAVAFRRRQLDAHCWIDVAHGFLRGGDELFAHLFESVAWQAHDRPMYDRIVAVPRLTAMLDINAADVPAVLKLAIDSLAARYHRGFDRIGCSLYRDGNDSVAWHGDRVGRTEPEPVVAVLTLGAARPFVMRPTSGGPSTRLRPASGDLVVMGGKCQTRWEHSVPKLTQSDPRISVMFRYGPNGRVPNGARLKSEARFTPRAPSSAAVPDAAERSNVKDRLSRS